MKTKRKYFYLDDFEHRLLVGCLMTARNVYIHEGKPIEDVKELILKIIDSPTKKLRVIAKEFVFCISTKAPNDFSFNYVHI